MKGIFGIRLQKLFLLVLCLKVASSGFGWYLGMPWSLGFFVPLSLMGAYILLGLYRHDDDVTDEKFADSCYYLGFIFTITSIIFSLFDLPSIGERIQDIAVRFGAAMVSTVLGLAVRVYLVSFRKDVADAIRDAEDAVLNATMKFSQQLATALDRLSDFEGQVDAAARNSVERVNTQVEALSKNHADKLGDFFADLTSRNQKIFDDALIEVKKSSERLGESVDRYSHGMRANLDSVGAKVDEFATGVTRRLQNTTFPDDFFAKHLESPLAQMKQAADSVLGETTEASNAVRQSSKTLSRALDTLGEKSGSIGSSLDTVLKLTKLQQAILDGAKGKADTLGALSSVLDELRGALEQTTGELGSSRGESAELVARISALIADGSETRAVLDRSLGLITGKLEDNATSIHALASQLGETNAAAISAAGKLDAVVVNAERASTSIAAGAAAAEKIVDKLGEIVEVDTRSTGELQILGSHAGNAVARAEQAITLLDTAAGRLEALDQAARVQGTELTRLVDRIANASTHTVTARDITTVAEQTVAAPPGAPRWGSTSAFAPELAQPQEAAAPFVVNLPTSDPLGR